MIRVVQRDGVVDAEAPGGAREGRAVDADLEAFRWIQRNAMDRRTPMKAVAQAVIESLS